MTWTPLPPPRRNALLKVIEEPDASTFFLLTTTGEKAVLPTIRSRCRGVRLPVWPESLIAKLLKKQGIPVAEAEELAGLSGRTARAWCLESGTTRGSGRSSAWRMRTFFHSSTDRGLPAASRALKDARDQADMLLDYTEGAALHLLRSDPDGPSSLRARKLLEALIPSAASPGQQRILAGCIG